MVTCPFCGHKWKPRTDNPILCCSHCMRKFRRPEPKVEIIGPDVMLATTCDICGERYDFLNVCRIDEETVLVCFKCLGEMTKAD